MEYFGWKTSVDPKTCVLEVIENVTDVFELNRGIPRVSDFPDDALIRMDRNFPKLSDVNYFDRSASINLTDFLV